MTAKTRPDAYEVEISGAVKTTVPASDDKFTKAGTSDVNRLGASAKISELSSGEGVRR